MAETEYSSVTWTTGDTITEAKLDSMVANDQAVNSHAQGSRYSARTAPASADVDANEIHIYGKAHGAVTSLYAKRGDDDKEQQVDMVGTYALSDSATINIDWEDATTQYVTLGGNRTLQFDNPIEGGRYILFLKQDGTGNRTVTWPTITWADGDVEPTLSTGASDEDCFGFVYKNSVWFCVGIAYNLS